MSRKLGRKHLEKKRARQKSAKKDLIERRLADRKEKRLEREREMAFEKEFNGKNKLGISNEEVQQRLENNMKLLEALEKQFIEEEEQKGTNNVSEKAQLQLETIEEFGKIQGEIINLQTAKKQSQENNQWTDEQEKQFATELEKLTQALADLENKRKENAL
jgi:hypothetical protein